MSKELMSEFLTKSGVSEEGISQFNDIFEKSVQAEVSSRYVQENEAVSRGNDHIRAMAEKHNIRKK